jgi:hypothetical protein
MNRSLQNSFSAAIVIAFITIPFSVHCQPRYPDCSRLKQGVFHSYPKNTADHFVTKRDGDFDHETNIKTGDTALWQLKWTGNCSYTLKYISGSGKMTAEALEILKKRRFVNQVAGVTDTYYLVSTYLDKASGPPLQTDTMWFAEKANVTSNELFRQIPNNTVLKRNHFSDTSKYAVMYVYRPGKTTNSLGNYIIYFDDNILCVAKNKSGYIFKVLKEGNFRVKSQLLKDESAINLQVKFGQVYYVKSMIHWGLFKRGYNFKLEMATVPPDQGKTEFENVDIQ